MFFNYQISCFVFFVLLCFLVLQWLHALRRRDQENHRLHQQLLKFLHTKSTGRSATGIVPPQVEIRGSLVAPPRASSASDSTRLRKQWDRTAADETRMYTVVYIFIIHFNLINFNFFSYVFGR